MNNLKNKQRHEKNLKRYLDLLSQKELSENDINTLKNTLSKYKDSLSSYQKEIIYKILNSSCYNLDKNHTKKGLDYLMNNTFKKNGELRKNNIFENFEISVLKDFRKFLLVGIEQIDEWTTRPIYRVIDKKGNYFNYISGRYNEIEIIYRHWND